METQQQCIAVSPRVIATWSFSEIGVKACTESLLGGKSALHAVVDGVLAVELDPTVTSVGYGGLPNSAGELELDAAVMDGNGQVGAVGALKGCKAAAPVARAVAENSQHSMLVGEGAYLFAKERGCTASHLDELLTPHARQRFEEYKASGKASMAECTTPNSPEDSLHTDTVGMICIDKEGQIAACCATSGMQFKLPGRVGDAPLIGAGVYVDGAVGAAVASGDGDQMIRFCIAVLVVEEMRRGQSPTAACWTIIDRVREGDPGCQAAVSAMHAKTGETGSACTRQGFKVVQWILPENNECVGVQVPTTTSVACPSKTPAWKHTCV